MYRAETELFSEPLIDYLANRGWTLMESEPDIAILRKIDDDQEEEIVLPRDRSYVDYHRRIMEAIQFLSKQEHCSVDSILNELFLQKWDILRIRINGDQIGVGDISYFDRGIIEEGLRKILLASARYVSGPKSYFKRLYSPTIEQWMKKCRSRAAESGSYILTVHMPLQEDDSSEIPFSRRVTEYLMGSLNQLIGLSKQPELLSETMEQLNLNANMCLGLAEMKPDENPIHFDFEMKWSSAIPIKRNIPSKVEIQDHHFSSIMSIGQKLIPKSKKNEDVFIGKVLALHGQADEQGKMQGEATLVLFMDEQQTKAKVVFEPNLYSLVCDAHKQNQYIRVSGVLSEKPRCSDLRDVSHFEVIS